MKINGINTPSIADLVPDEITDSYCSQSIDRLKLFYLHSFNSQINSYSVNHDTRPPQNLIQPIIDHYKNDQPLILPPHNSLLDRHHLIVTNDLSTLSPEKHLLHIQDEEKEEKNSKLTLAAASPDDVLQECVLRGYQAPPPPGHPSPTLGSFPLS